MTLRDQRWTCTARHMLLASYLLAACGYFEDDETLHQSKDEIGEAFQALGSPSTSPDTNCSWYEYNDREYWFCVPARQWQDARTRCQSVGLDLVAIETAAENAFVASHIELGTWMGATDTAVEGEWRWVASNAQFWQGGANGNTVGGLHASWFPGEPNNFFNEDCLATSFSGLWNDEFCSNYHSYVCEGLYERNAVEIFSPAPHAGAFTPEAGADVNRSAWVVIDAEAIAARTNQFLDLNLFPDRKLRAIGVRVERQLPSGLVWVGEVQNDPQSVVTLSVRNNVVTGTIRTGDELYDIQYAGDGVHILYDLDPDTFDQELEPGTSFNGLPSNIDPCGGTETGESIDVAVHYTTQLRVASGGVDAVEARAYEAVAQTNRTYRMSGIRQRLRLVHLSELAYSEGGSNVIDSNRLGIPDDGHGDEIHTLRETHNADVIMVLTQGNSSGCGRAFQIMSAVTPEFGSQAVAIARYNCSTSQFTFAHELGHLMGARHEWLHDSTNNAPFTYNHGYTDAMGTADIMAVDGRRDGRWANPDMGFGVPLSEPEPTDTVRTLNNTAAAVASFRCTRDRAEDVWMRDTWEDSGEEPDPQTTAQVMHASPYIWVRNTQDTALEHQHGHQNPILGQQNWLYTKLHNGADTVQNGTLELYWANASAGLTWPASWTLIGSVSVSGFAANSTRVVELEWSTLPGGGHFCLLARWVSAQDPMAFVETNDVETNVRNNNNIVWRNVNILTPSPSGSMDAMFYVQAPDSADAVALMFGPVAEETNGSFLNHGSATLTFDAATWEAIEDAGEGVPSGSGFTVVGDRTIRVTDPAGALLVMLPFQGRHPVEIQLTRPVGTPQRTFRVEAQQFAAAYGLEIVWRVGGVVYELAP